MEHQPTGERERSPAELTPRIAAQLRAIVGTEHLSLERIEQELENTLGVDRRALGIIYPGCVAQVQQIVHLAAKERIPLYPISCGRNTGYGDKAPVADGQLIVDLHRMNSIRAYDERLGQLIVEPGVTQEQLSAFLRDSKFMCDVSGASIHASTLGNTLDGGFGHTPLGNHRRLCTDVEVVLGNGVVLTTGTFPGLGPDLAGLFVQSNFGIVTAMRLQLMPRPEYFTAFVIRFNDEAAMCQAVDDLRTLRQDGTLPSLVHIANATRTLVTIGRFPVNRKRTGIITDREAADLLSTPLMKVRTWVALGGLYGRKDSVRCAQKALRKALRKHGQVAFYSDRSVRLINGALKSPVLSIVPGIEQVREQFASFLELRQLLNGVPSERPAQHIGWHITAPDRIGLLWFSPVIAAEPSAVATACAVARDILSRFGFECPITMTLVEPQALVGVISIHFDRCTETQRAHNAYIALHEEFAKHGMRPYRTSILGMQLIAYDGGKQQTLDALKRALDPSGIIAPGRYHIGPG